MIKREIRQNLFILALVFYSAGLLGVLVGWFYPALIIMICGGACFCLGLQHLREP
jgi:hypothetical protein